MMGLKALLLDGTAIATTASLFVLYNVLRFAISLYRARSRMLKLKARGLPMPPYHPLFGHLLFAYKITSRIPSDANPNYLLDLARRELPELGPIFYLDTWPFGPQMLAIGSLDGLRQVTQDHSLPKYHALKTFLEPIADGKDIVTMEGAAWKKWRTVFNPGFSMSNLLTLVAGIVEETSVFCQSLHTLSQSGKVFRMKDLTDHLTLDIISSIVLEVKLHSQTTSNQLARGLRSQTKWLIFGGDVNALQAWNPVRPVVLWYNKRRMNRFILPHLDRHLGNVASSSKSIVNLASKSYHSNGEKPACNGVVDPIFRDFALSQIKLFLFSGHDTTSSSVCYLFYILSTHPEIRDRLRAEHDEIFGDEDPANTIKNIPAILNQLPYTIAVIKETLRLYPAVSSVRAGEPGYEVRDEQGRSFPTEGFLVWANPQALQRDPTLWPKPDEVIPERWLVTAEDPLHPIKGAWRPFDLGPRNCIGQELAMMEMKVILVMTTRVFNIETAYHILDGQNSAKTSKNVYGQRGYQAMRAQPSDDLPCTVSLGQ